MSRVSFLISLLFIFSITFVYAQSYSGFGNNYTGVESYDGALNSRAFTIRVESNKPFNIEKGWRLSVRATPRGGKKEFPMQRVSLRPSAVEGSANDPGPLPTIGQLGIAPINILHKGAEVFLINSSSVPLYHRGVNSSYFNFNLLFNLSVEGGSYLNILKGAEYTIDFVFTFYTFDYKVLGEVHNQHKIGVWSLSGPPPTENNFSLEISSPAKNGVLEIKSMSDYINGAIVKYDKGITVSSNAPFQLTVKSMQNEFKSDMGNTLPLDVVNVKLVPNNFNVSTVNEVNISTAPQILLIGNSTNSLPQSLDLIYSTKGNDERLFKTKSENYSTTLTYEMTVQ